MSRPAFAPSPSPAVSRRFARGLVIGALLVLWGCTSRTEPAPPAQHEASASRPAPSSCHDAVPEPPELFIAGSGSNLALARALAPRFRRAHPRLSVEVADSIGTSGALRAVADGAIDLGLASRRLRSAELARGLVQTPYVRVEVAWIAGPGVEQDEIAAAELLESLRGARPRWRSGRAVALLLREEGDSSNRAFSEAVDGFSDALRRARAAGRWRVCYKDQEMELALARTPGALGLLDLGTLRLGPAGRVAHPLALHKEDGSPVRVHKELSFLTLGPPDGAAAAFIELARSPSAADLLAQGGYELLPLGRSR